MIDAAVIGLGRWGKRVSESIGQSDRIRIVRGMDPDPDARREYAGLHAVPVADNYDEILAADDIDAVLLITPPSTHLDLAMRALEAGKQVFCEKPLALTRADAVTMVEAFAAKGMVLGIDHERRFEPGWEELQELVKSGGLGKILHVEANHSHAWMGDLPDGHWRGLKTEGPSSPYTGMGIHFMDLFTSLFGPLDQVFSYAVDRTLGFASGDVSTAQFRFPDGTTGTIAAIAATPVFIRVAVFGEDGWMEVREAIDEAGIRRSEVTLSMRDQELEHRGYDPTDTVRLSLEAWVDAVEKGVPYRYEAEEMINNVAAVEAITLSQETGQPARIADLD